LTTTRGIGGVQKRFTAYLDQSFPRLLVEITKRVIVTPHATIIMKSKTTEKIR
jgi:hypothetical protein